MFDFLRKNSKEQQRSIIDLITINAKKASISDMALEKAAGMIAKAIAKSEFKVKREKGLVKDDVYWVLNVKPNENEMATEFWVKAVQDIFLKGECLIVPLNKKLFRASSFNVSDTVVDTKEYSDIELETKDSYYKINRTFRADEVMHLKNTNKNIVNFLKKNIEIYNDIASGLAAAKKIGSIPKFNLDVEASQPVIMTTDKEGNPKRLSIDDYKENIKKMLESENIEIITNQSGLKVGQMQINTNATAEDISKMRNEIFTECAYAFDIPKTVFLGEITEKADSTNEFITFAVNWVIEMLNDAINAVLVGKESYLSGKEKIWIDISRYKHVDIIESANGLDKLRAIGYTLDELFEITGWEPIGTEFSKKRALTKNYADETEVK